MFNDYIKKAEELSKQFLKKLDHIIDLLEQIEKKL